MAKAWGHSRSGIEGLRPDLITSLAGGSVPDPKSDHSHMADAVGYACVALAKGLLPYSIGQSGFQIY